MDAIEHHRRHPAGAQQIPRHGQSMGEPLGPQDRQTLQTDTTAHEVVDFDRGADIHIGHLLTTPLGLGEHPRRHGSLPRRAIADQLAELAPWQPADPQGVVQGIQAGGTDGYVGLGGISEAIDGPRAPAPLQGGDRRFESFGLS